MKQRPSLKSFILSLENPVFVHLSDSFQFTAAIEGSICKFDNPEIGDGDGATLQHALHRLFFLISS
jgi:hypothetical protein